MKNWKLLKHLSKKDNERYVCQDLLTIKNTDMDLKLLESACDALCKWATWTRQTFRHFCKLTKQRETIRNYKNRFWVWLGIVLETHKLTWYLKLARTTSASRYYSFTARNWSLVFDPEKLTFSWFLFHAVAVKNRQENLATPIIWSRNVTTSTRESRTCAWIRADKCCQGGRNLF